MWKFIQMKQKNTSSLSRSALLFDKLYISVAYIFVAIFTVLVALPILHVISSSVSNVSAISAGKVWVWPVGFDLTGFKAVFSMSTLWMGYKNSLLYVVMNVTISITVTVISAYPLSRRNFGFNKIMTNILLVSMLFSGGMIPAYIVIMKLNLINSAWSLVLPGAVIPMYIFMLRNYMRSNIPEEMFEAATMDGCNHFRYLLSIVVPLCKPMLAVFVLWIAVGQWNSYFAAMMYLQDYQKYPLQLVLSGLLVAGDFSVGATEEYANRQQLRYLLQYSLIIISSLPMVLLYPLIQRYFVKGIVIGAVKG